MNVHAQHDVHTVKMEHPKIIKNTAQRKNPIIQEKTNQVRGKAKFTAFKPCRNRGRGTRVEDVLVDTHKISANGAKGTEHQSGAPREDFSGCSTSTRLSRNPTDRAEGADDAERC